MVGESGSHTLVLFMFIDQAVELDLYQIFQLLGSLSANNYLVGGCVRDYQLGVSPNDWDVVTDIHMDDIQKIFQSNGWRVTDAGKKFLVLAVSKNGRQYDIANFRKDSTTSDGRRPDKVSIGTLQDDAFRRDFTINALYLSADKSAILDPTDMGLSDLTTKTLRFIGKPEDRIREDYLRVFRFYRFIKSGFTPHPKSLKACREFFNEAYVRTTAERVRNEIEKMVGLA